MGSFTPQFSGLYFCRCNFDQSITCDESSKSSSSTCIIIFFKCVCISPHICTRINLLFHAIFYKPLAVASDSSSRPQERLKTADWTGSNASHSSPRPLAQEEATSLSQLILSLLASVPSSLSHPPMLVLLGFPAVPCIAHTTPIEIYKSLTSHQQCPYTQQNTHSPSVPASLKYVFLHEILSSL